MKLEIISPEKVVYTGEATSVSLPGLLGAFTVLDRHAPIISILVKGNLTYIVNGKAVEMTINGGFAEVNKNIVSVCIE
jgi:F-type H+-transporting ATPase subunit epsilon